MTTPKKNHTSKDPNYNKKKHISKQTIPYKKQSKNPKKFKILVKTKKKYLKGMNLTD